MTRIMVTRIWEIGFFLGLLFCWLMPVQPMRVSEHSMCPAISPIDSILRFHDSCLTLDSLSYYAVGVKEVDEVSLAKALNLLHSNSRIYVSVLFYASWCPFSKTLRHTLATLSSLFPAIHFYAIEESAIRPSLLSRYGVFGFPTLFLQNSTTRMRYRGSRTLNSLKAFYRSNAGIEPVSLDPTTVEKIAKSSNIIKHEIEQENCPFSWARSPEKLLHQETYLVLATSFLLLRLLCFLLPALVAHVKLAWRRHLWKMTATSFMEQPQAFLGQAMQILDWLKPCKRGNLQEGALNARAWASKSLASVSFGEGSSSTPRSVSERR